MTKSTVNGSIDLMTKSEENSFRIWHEAMHENARLRADNARLMEERSRLKEAFAEKEALVEIAADNVINRDIFKAEPS